MNPLALDRAKTAVLLVDVQERLCAAMPPEALARMVRRARALLEGAQALELPIFCTEQYPKGLGPTVGELTSAMPGVTPWPKVQFSAVLPELLSALQGRTQVLITGMEAHICVYQTARDLARLGLLPVLCADAVLSRTEEDRRVGLALAQEAGARVGTVESVLFDLLGTAGSDAFKRVSAAVK